MHSIRFSLTIDLSLLLSLERFNQGTGCCSVLAVLAEFAFFSKPFDESGQTPSCIQDLLHSFAFPYQAGNSSLASPSLQCKDISVNPGPNIKL